MAKGDGSKAEKQKNKKKQEGNAISNETEIQPLISQSVRPSESPSSAEALPAKTSQESGSTTILVQLSPAEIPPEPGQAENPVQQPPAVIPPEPEKEKKDSKSKGTNLADLFIFFSENLKLALTATALMGILAILMLTLGLLSLGGTFWILDWSPSVNIGGLSVSFHRKALKAQEPSKYTLHACARWCNSGIKVPAGASVRIRASGRVNLALHHLVAAAIADTRPSMPWTDPDGVPFKPHKGDSFQDQQKKTWRSQGQILPNADSGCLLIALVPTAESKKPEIPNRPRPDKLFNFDDKNHTATDGLVVKNDETSEVELWFAVNDVYLDSQDPAIAAKVYRGDPMGPDSQQTDANGQPPPDDLEARWRRIHSDGYYDLFWDDNIGHFDISVEAIE